MKNNRTVFRRILSLFLAIVMCISIQDTAVFAASEDTLPVKEDASVSEIQKAEQAIVRGLKQRKEYVSLEGCQVTAKNMETALMNPKYRFPQYFVSSITYDTNAATKMAAGAKITYSLNAEEAANRQKEMAQAAAEIVNSINSADRELKDYEKAWLVNQWLAKICENDGAAVQSPMTASNPYADVHSAYGALVNKKAQADGYAQAYQYIMRDLLGIPCLIVKNTAGTLAWNMVKIDGKYYHVDVAWSRNSSEPSAAFGSYFLLTDEELKAADQAAGKSLHNTWSGPYDMEAADGSSYQERNPLWMQKDKEKAAGTFINNYKSGIVYYEGYFYFSIYHGIYRVADLLDYDGTTSPQRVCYTDGETETWEDPGLKGHTMSQWISICEYHDCLYFNGIQRIYRLNLKNDAETKTDNNLTELEDIVVEDITAATLTSISMSPIYNALLGADQKLGSTFIYDFKTGEDTYGEPIISFRVKGIDEQASAYYLRRDLLGDGVEVTGAADPLQVGQELKAESKIHGSLKPDYHSSARGYYRWYRDDFVICRNTTGVYTTTEEDIGKTLRVVVTYDNYKKNFSKKVGVIPKQVPEQPSRLPAGLAGEKGGALKNVALPEGYEWKTPDTVLAQTGKASYPAIYCPDSDKYETIEVSVEVEVKECSHVWDNGKITKRAKCKTPGERTFTCTKCGGTKIEEIPARGTEHRWDAGKVTKNATCTATGTRERTCITCGDKKTEEIEKTSHTFKKTGKVTKEPTAKEKGSFTTACSVCKTEKTETLLYAKTGNFTSGMTYVKVRSSAKDVNDNNVVAKLKKNTVIRVFEKGGTSTWTKICYNNQTAYLMTKYVVQDKEETPKEEDPKDETPKDTAPKAGSKVTVGKTSYKVMKNNTVEFTKMSAASGTVTIPAAVKINGKTYKVTSVAAKAFKNNKKVRKVVIGKNITKIGAEAFRGCKNLKTIAIKSTKLKSVGKNAIKSIYKKAKISCPKKQKAAYKKLFKSSTGYKKTMKIK